MNVSINASTTNVTETSVVEAYSCLFTDTYIAVRLAVTSLVILSAWFGNTLILWSLFKFTNHFRAGLYIFMGNLALSDLLFGASLAMYPIEYIFPESVQCPYFCVVRGCLMIVAYMSASGTLMFISMDRYMAISQPMKHLWKSTQSRMFKTVSGIWWIISIAFGSVPLIDRLTDDTDLNNKLPCRTVTVFSDTFQSVMISAFLLQFGINVGLYATVAVKIRRQINSFPRSSLRQPRKDANTRTMLIVFIVFLLCWIPFGVTSFLGIATKDIFYDCLTEYLVSLGLMHSAFNWVIYGLSNRKFKAAFYAIFTCQNIQFT